MGSDQQFCLRWHNHQSSLLTSLPQLLDGDDLTDVTLSAGGRSLRAHKVVLSACSIYFKELFKALQPMQHPVIVLPGASFTNLCALVTFMYNGEVNIYQEQLQGLIHMAEAMQIRGLAEMTNGNGSVYMNGDDVTLPTKEVTNKSVKRPKTTATSQSVTMDTAYVPPQTDAVESQLPKLGRTGFEIFRDLDRSIKKQPIRYEDSYPSVHHNGGMENWARKTEPEYMEEEVRVKVEDADKNADMAISLKKMDDSTELEYLESKVDHDDHSPCSEDSLGPSFISSEIVAISNKTSPSAANKLLAGSKLFATCLVCGKQLSNQYNLRVHMETHQNVNYACNICSHVSRSRDALRKHVSYRHPLEGRDGARDRKPGGTPKKGKPTESQGSLSVQDRESVFQDTGRMSHVTNAMFSRDNFLNDLKGQ